MIIVTLQYTVATVNVPMSNSNDVNLANTLDNYEIVVSFDRIEDVSINNEYEHENDFKPYSYSKSFSQLSMLAMTPSSSL